LRHPRELQTIALPFELDKCGTNTKAKRKFLSSRFNDAIIGQRERRSDHGMTGELHFIGGSENPQAHVGALRLGGLDERAFGKLGFARHRLHFGGGQPVRVGEHGQLIARQRLVGEDVVLQVTSAIDDGRPSDLLSGDSSREGSERQRRCRQTQP